MYSKKIKLLLPLFLAMGFLGARAQNVFPLTQGSALIQEQVPRAQFKLTFGIPVVADTTHGLNGGLDSLGLMIMIKSSGAIYARDTVITGGHVWAAVGVSSGSPGTWGSITGTLSTQTDLQSALNAKQASLGFTPIAPADTAHMLSTYLLLAVAQTLFYPISANPAGYLQSNGLPNVTNFLQIINAGGLNSGAAGTYALRPSAGQAGRIYIATDSVKIYYDNGSTWLTITGGSGGGGSSVWGGITGTLSSQTDLQNALNLKLNKSDTATMLSAYLLKTLVSGKMWVGNGSGLAAQVSASGDVSLANTGAFTVTGIQGKALSLATGVLAYNGSTIAFTNTVPQAIGTINGQSKSANGAVLNTGSLYYQTVDYTFPGLQTPADKLFIDSLHNFPDSVRLFLGHDSIYLGIKYANQPEIAKYQFRIDTLTAYTFINSLTQSGTNVGLTGDVTLPASLNYYGTNISGVRGYYPLPSTPANLGASYTASAVTVTSSSGSSVVIPGATNIAAGMFTSAYKLRADSIHYQMNAAAVSGADTFAYRKPYGVTGGDTTVFKRIIFRNGTNTTITDNSTQDLIDITFNSTGGGSGGSGNTNSNSGAQFRLAFPNTNNIRTIGTYYGGKIDSTTFSNALAIGPDTSLLMTIATAQVVTGSKVFSAVQTFTNNVTLNNNIYAANIPYALAALNQKIDVIVEDTTVGGAGQFYRRSAQFVDTTGKADGSLVQWSATAQNFIMGSRTSGFGDPGANGIVVRTASNVSSAVTLMPGSGNIVITNGSGVAGNPTIDIGASVVTAAGAATLTNKTIAIGQITGALPVTQGGTGNGFFTVAGPASSAKTYTFPNASANVLTDNALITVAQGGTGAATLAGYIFGNGTGAFTASTTIPVASVTGAAPINNATMTGTFTIPATTNAVTALPGASDIHPATDAFVTNAVGSSDITATALNTYTINHTVQGTEGSIFMNGSTLTLTMPSAASSFGRIVKMKNLNATAVTLSGMGSGEVTNLAAFGTNGDGITAQSDGSFWHQIAGSIYPNTVALAFGTYTPTIPTCGICNPGGTVTISPAIYHRVGNTVTVDGLVTVTESTAGTSGLVLTVPISSNMTFGGYGEGTGTSGVTGGAVQNTTQVYIGMLTSPVGAHLLFNSINGSESIYYHYQYFID